MLCVLWLLSFTIILFRPVLCLVQQFCGVCLFPQQCCQRLLRVICHVGADYAISQPAAYIARCHFHRIGCRFHVFCKGAIVHIGYYVVPLLAVQQVLVDEEVVDIRLVFGAPFKLQSGKAKQYSVRS